MVLTVSIAVLSMRVAGADRAELAWLRGGQVETRTLANATVRSAGLKASAKVPLGSLWKLFVFAYLAQTQTNEQSYICSQKRSATRSDEERYCCDPGERIDRDQALARSCAPYFSPTRLKIDARQWRTHWQNRARHADWLLDMQSLRPDTEVSVEALLHALESIAPEARAASRTALLEVGLEGYGRAAWPALGSGIRYKTYSWHRSDAVHVTQTLGGAAGWLVDGTPFWFGARGSSRTALDAWAEPLAAALPQPDWRAAGRATADTSCVDVDFFARYPIRAVWKAQEPVEAASGTLYGRYRVQFANGNWLSFVSQGELALDRIARPGSGQDGAPENATSIPVIRGRFTINDYVARVIDREGNAGHVQAARALAIAARTYLLQNARFSHGCWQIADASRTQRVSPDPPSAEALAAAWFSDDIVLQGVAVQYHQHAAGPNRLAWQDAVAQAAQGWNFERILSRAYPQAVVGTLSGRTECQRLEAAEDWLSHAARRWRMRLQREAGFEALERLPSICALSDGHPYADERRMRIYVRGWRSLNERLSLAHEYLHLALRFHPNGNNEDYVERLARQLIEG